MKLLKQIMKLFDRMSKCAECCDRGICWTHQNEVHTTLHNWIREMQR